MLKEICIPELEEGVENVSLSELHIKVGDSVTAGDLVAEIETDKVTIDVETAYSGEITEILLTVGEENIGSGTVIARLNSL